MPACSYCILFMPDWNQIVSEFKAAYGDKIQFLKVDGIQDRFTASRYDIHSYPSFIALEPGTGGEDWIRWKPAHRDKNGMKLWIT